MICDNMVMFKEIIEKLLVKYMHRSESYTYMIKFNKLSKLTRKTIKLTNMENEEDDGNDKIEYEDDIDLA
jgi:hypothetical protein